jgi:hypothetical protein
MIDVLFFSLSSFFKACVLLETKHFPFIAIWQRPEYQYVLFYKIIILLSILHTAICTLDGVVGKVFSRLLLVWVPL